VRTDHHWLVTDFCMLYVLVRQRKDIRLQCPLKYLFTIFLNLKFKGETNIILLQSLFHYLKSKSKINKTDGIQSQNGNMISRYRYFKLKSKSKIYKTGMQNQNGKHNFLKSLDI